MRDRTKSVKSHPVSEVPDEGTNVLFDVWLLSRAATGLIDEAVSASGLNADEFAFYSVLTSADGLTPSELARWMSAPATTVSSYVNRFEKRGHVRRDRNPEDGRSYVVRLTAAGRRAHQAAVEGFIPALGAVQAGLASHEATVRRSMKRLRECIECVDGDDPVPSHRR